MFNKYQRSVTTADESKVQLSADVVTPIAEQFVEDLCEPGVSYEIRNYGFDVILGEVRVPVEIGPFYANHLSRKSGQHPTLEQLRGRKMTDHEFYKGKKPLNDILRAMNTRMQVGPEKHAFRVDNDPDGATNWNTALQWVKYPLLRGNYNHEHPHPRYVEQQERIKHVAEMDVIPATFRQKARHYALVVVGAIYSLLPIELMRAFAKDPHADPKLRSLAVWMSVSVCAGVLSDGSGANPAVTAFIAALFWLIVPTVLFIVWGEIYYSFFHQRAVHRVRLRGERAYYRVEPDGLIHFVNEFGKKEALKPEELDLIREGRYDWFGLRGGIMLASGQARIVARDEDPTIIRIGVSSSPGRGEGSNSPMARRERYDLMRRVRLKASEISA